MATIRYLCPVCGRRNERRGVEEDGLIDQICPGCKISLTILVRMVERTVHDATPISVMRTADMRCLRVGR